MSAARRVTTVFETNLNECPVCGDAYGRQRRCYKCKPPRRGNRSATSEAAQPKPRRFRLPDPDMPHPALKLPGLDPNRAARIELRAMAEVLRIVGPLEPATAHRVLSWAAARLAERTATPPDPTPTPPEEPTE